LAEDNVIRLALARILDEVKYGRRHQRKPMATEPILHPLNNGSAGKLMTVQEPRAPARYRRRRLGPDRFEAWPIIEVNNFA
jgi:hypothetical protein